MKLSQRWRHHDEVLELPVRAWMTRRNTELTKAISAAKSSLWYTRVNGTSIYDTGNRVLMTTISAVKASWWDVEVIDTSIDDTGNRNTDYVYLSSQDILRILELLVRVHNYTEIDYQVYLSQRLSHLYGISKLLVRAYMSWRNTKLNVTISAVNTSMRCRSCWYEPAYTRGATTTLSSSLERNRTDLKWDTILSERKFHVTLVRLTSHIKNQNHIVLGLGLGYFTTLTLLPRPISKPVFQRTKSNRACFLRSM